MDFFYCAGFFSVPFKPDNWCGEGVLVDFSDLILPTDHRWRAHLYGRKVKIHTGTWALEGMNHEGLRYMDKWKRRKIARAASTGQKQGDRSTGEDVAA